MSIQTLDFSLNDPKINPRAGKSARIWKIAALALLVTVLIQGYFLYIKPSVKSHSPSHSVPALGKDTEIAVITHKATDFISKYLSFSATQLEEHKREMIKMMTLEYANAYQIVWQDPTLTAAIQQRNVNVSVDMDAPSLKQVDEEGRIYVNVSGKVIVNSDLTYIKNQQRYFSGTVVLINTDEGHKVANVIWKNEN